MVSLMNGYRVNNSSRLREKGVAGFLQQSLVFILFFFALTGYYGFLIFWQNHGFGDTRILTMPLRGLTLFVLLFLWYMNGWKISFKEDLVKLFLLFSVLYLLRIGYEYFVGNDSYHKPLAEIFMYFLFLVLVPFVVVSSSEIVRSFLDVVFWSVILGGFVVALESIFFYGQHLGYVNRISSVMVKDSAGFVSPLALSYTASISIGAALAKLKFDKSLNGLVRLFLLVVMGISLVPLVLGASRGSVLSLLAPFFILFVFVKGVKKKLVFLILYFVVLFVLFYALEYFGGGVIVRLEQTYYNYLYGDYSAAGMDRVLIYQNAIGQFLDDPFFGNSMESEYANYYPHNIILEVLLTTGIIGFVVFFLLLRRTLVLMKKILSDSDPHAWIVFFVVQVFVMNMFSGALYSSVWFFLGLAFLVLKRTPLKSVS